MTNKFPQIPSVNNRHFLQSVKEALDLLSGKQLSSKRALLYEDLFPNGIFKLENEGLTPKNDPTQDYHIANKQYVDKVSRRSFLFGVLNE